ncbi:MAG: SDR family oxidoreductase [Leptolyngbyaceae cyanobacterium bins.59]|nr:SDR family oxidoreductase [Leptolyngbyaceae cyanobacterium bins.59]
MAPIALVTGSSQGIGKATALHLAREGYDIVLTARHADRLSEAAQEIEAMGRRAVPIPADMRDMNDVHSLVHQAIGHFGYLDLLVNNAGIYSAGPVDGYSLEDWHDVLDLNLWGYIHAIHAVLPYMLQRGQGMIVNISSISGQVPVPYLVPYTTSKFAVHGMTEALRTELAPKGIHVCGIYPNLIHSDFMERAKFVGPDAAGRREQLEAVLKAPVVEKPEDVARAIVDAVKHRKAEVMVGSAQLSKAAYKVIPGPMQWMFRQAFKERGKDEQRQPEGIVGQ